VRRSSTAVACAVYPSTSVLVDASDPGRG
jgi:hypothetical protein